MKKLCEIALVFIISLGTLSLSSSATAYCRDGNCHYYHHHHHRHCYWVGGHWSHGHWHPRHKVCRW